MNWIDKFNISDNIMCHIIIYPRCNTVSRNDLPLNVRRMLVFILAIPAQQGITYISIQVVLGVVLLCMFFCLLILNF